MTAEELKSNGYVFHHRAIHRGYTRVEDRGIPIPYVGRFGEGYIVKAGPRLWPGGKASTQFQYVDYYIKEK